MTLVHTLSLQAASSPTRLHIDDFISAYILDSPISTSQQSLSRLRYPLSPRPNAPSPIRIHASLLDGPSEPSTPTPTQLYAGFLSPPQSPFTPTTQQYSHDRTPADIDYLPSPSSILTLDAIYQLEGLANTLNERHREQSEEADVTTPVGRKLRLVGVDVMSVRQHLPRIVVAEAPLESYDRVEEQCGIQDDGLLTPTKSRMSAWASRMWEGGLDSPHTEDIEWLDEYGTWGDSKKGKWLAPCIVDDEEIVGETEFDQSLDEPCFAYDSVCCFLLNSF